MLDCLAIAGASIVRWPATPVAIRRSIARHMLRAANRSPSRPAPWNRRSSANCQRPYRKGAIPPGDERGRKRRDRCRPIGKDAGDPQANEQFPMRSAVRPPRWPLSSGGCGPAPLAASGARIAWRIDCGRFRTPTNPRPPRGRLHGRNRSRLPSRFPASRPDRAHPSCTHALGREQIDQSANRPAQSLARKDRTVGRTGFEINRDRQQGGRHGQRKASSRGREW